MFTDTRGNANAYRILVLNNYFIEDDDKKDSTFRNLISGAGTVGSSQGAG